MNMLKKKHDAKVLFTDTESLVYELKHFIFVKLFIKINTGLT